MKIIKHGFREPPRPIVHRVTCEICHCVFECEHDEIVIDTQHGREASMTDDIFRFG